MVARSITPPAPGPAPLPAALGRAVAVRPPGGGVPSVAGPQPSEPAAPEAASGSAGPLEDLHPALWRAHQMARSHAAVLRSGFAGLDAELPGGGWPVGTLTELLLDHPGVGELRLLAPALVALASAAPGSAAAALAAGRGLLLFDPPALPCGSAWQALGLPLQQLVVVRQRVDGARGRAGWRLPAADTLWALEQALKSGQAGAVLGWLPQRLPADALRRLQLAAQAHPGPAFLFRGVEARSQPSMAPLRLLLKPAGPDEVRVQILKRRGPPLVEPLVLMLAPVLSEPLRLRAQAVRMRSGMPAAAGRRDGRLDERSDEGRDGQTSGSERITAETTPAAGQGSR